MEWLQQLSVPVISLLGTTIVATLGYMLVHINRLLYKWIFKKIWEFLKSKFTYKKLKKDEIDRDGKIREILIELRTIVHADRTCLFQFHNGSVFTTKNPIWRLSNTHESVSPGISSEIGKLQDMKASSMTEVLQSFWGEDYIDGVEKISPTYCKDCPNASKTPHGKKVVFIDVAGLEDCYSKSLLVEQGIKYVLDSPIHNSDGNCVGFIAVNYCGEHDPEEMKKYSRDICRNASQIQFLLLG